MKTLVLRPRVLRPYVPLRLHLSESALRVNMFCITSSFENLCKLAFDTPRIKSLPWQTLAPSAVAFAT
ncbi:hypothetical protein SAMN05421730_100636 [Anaerobium acetethylicum]|uniref:Uncharacterized protein n=1 Tax=Anaerobium acetethylicum TaxID=1619234 RepID=A0A1D3TSF2_9FIRM|nr:hypothetical protein SAMN05421730_100636 [Anaerobium acetethylicum]